MADEKVGKEQDSIITNKISSKLIKCSNCNRIISLGEPYIKLILTEKIICSDCDEGLFEGDNFHSIEN